MTAAKPVRMLRSLTAAALLMCSTLAFAEEAPKDMRGAYLHRADLHGADLRGADLRKAQLSHADLKGADLRGARLDGAYLYKADLRGADLRGAVFSTKLRGAELAGVDLTGALFDETTVLPFGPSTASRRAMAYKPSASGPARVAAAD